MSKHQKKKSGPAGSLSTDDRARLDSIVEDLSLLTPSSIGERLKSPALAISFLERVPRDHPSTPALVLGIRDAFPQKEVQKAVRRALFRLKQTGVPVPEQGKEGGGGPLELRPEQPQGPTAYLSPPDGAGNRAVYISIPRFPAGVDLAMGLVSDEKGVLEFVFGRHSKKKAKEMREVFFQNVSDLVETSLSHAAAVLETAYSKGKSGPNASAGDYLEVRPWLLGNVTMPDRPLIYELISPESVRETALTDSQVDKLLGHRWMRTWITDPEEIRPLVEEVMKVEQSPILVSPEQKNARILDLKEGYTSKIYKAERRALMKSRLEESAYLFHKVGEEDYAGLALRAALSMEEGDSPFGTSDFLRHMVEHSLGLYLRQVGKEQQQKEESSSKLILPR